MTPHLADLPMTQETRMPCFTRESKPRHSGNLLSGNIVAKRIIDKVSRHTGVSVDKIMGRRRTSDVSLARQMAMKLTRDMTPLSLTAIGSIFRRDHGTVIHACLTVLNQIDTNRNFAMEWDALKADCEMELK